MILFNDAFNTFYLRLYGVGHMVKDHSDTEREETRCCPSYFFRVPARDHLYATSKDRIAHTMAFVTLVGTRNSSVGPP